MKVETIGGALIAASILFVSGFLALFQQNGVESWRDISEAAWWVLAGGAVLSFLKDYQALSTRRVIASMTGKKVPPTLLAAVLAVTFSIGGCALVAENESTARITTTYATLKVIDDDADKAARVIEIATEVKTFASDDPEATVDALIVATRALIRWDRLDRADAILVDTLLLELARELKERLGAGVLPEAARLTVVMVADWVISAAALAVSE